MKSKKSISPVNELPSHDFLYYDTEGKKSVFPIHDLSIPPVPKNLIVLNDETLQCVGGHCNRSGTTQTSDWYLIDGEKKTDLFHERAFFPWSCFEKSSVEYWLTCAYSTTIIGIIRLLKEKGCDVTKWHAQHGWYSEQTEYFPITQDFDEALKLLGYAYQGEKVEVTA